MKQVFLSVIIPSYNEMANLQKGVLDKIAHFFSHKQYSYEVIIVDDGSTDGSIEFVEAFTEEEKEFSLIKNPHLGKGGAVITGMLAAKGEYRLFTDMDQATPIEELDKLLPFLEKDFDIAIGSRNTERKGAPVTRLLISRSSIILRKLLVGIRDINDTQCGFKMFTANAAEEIFTRLKTVRNDKRTTGAAVTFGFDIELLLMAKKLHLQVKEVPVKWLHVETRRVNPVTDSINGVVDLIKIRRNMIKGLYKT